MPQLETWRNKKERHEQIAVGDSLHKSSREMRLVLDEIGRRAEGKGKGKPVGLSVEGQVVRALENKKRGCDGKSWSRLDGCI